MNEELRIHVERAVRPLHASFERKMQMREELGLLMGQIHAEESQRNSNPERVLQATYERFGDPIVLRRELQATVHPFERIANQLLGLMARGMSESRFGHAVRIGAISAAHLGIVTLFSQSLLLLLLGEGLQWMQIRVLLLMAGAVFVDALAVTWLATRCHELLSPQEWTSGWFRFPLWMAGMVAGLTIMATKLALIALAGGDGAALIRAALQWTWGLPAIALIFVIGVQMFEHERSRAADWEGLELD